MEWAEIPMGALFHGARNDRERCAIALLDREAWLRRREVASHVTVTVGGDGVLDEDSAIATIDWDGVVRSLKDTSSNTVHTRGAASVLAVACSLACGHLVDLAEVTGSLRHRPDLAAYIASALVHAAGHSDHVVRWPRRPVLPSYMRIVDSHGSVVQEAGDAPEEERRHELGPPWLRTDTTP